MSKAYAEKFKTKEATPLQLKNFLKAPGARDKDGNIQYTTEQAHKDACDINKIITRYTKTGLITNVSKIEAKYGDISGLQYKEALDLIINSKQMFKELPSNIRKEFENNPGKLLEFMEDPNNRKKAEELGIINPSWTPETDGLGEHIKTGENKTKTPTEPPVE